MKSRVLAAIVVLGIGATGVGASNPLVIRDDFQQLRDIVVHGTVYATIDGRRGPVNGASVELESPSGKVVASVVTDATGNYAITNPSRSAGASYYDVNPGTYVLYGSYRTKRASVGTVKAAPTTTITRDIDLGMVVKSGGAAPPPPSTAFFVTDRLRNQQSTSTSVSTMFENGRLIDPCTTGADCMMSYGEAHPTGPFLNGVPVSSVTDLIAKMRAVPQFASASSALVFIHGYNQDFADPMNIGATWLSSFDSSEPVIVYSWASNHQTPKYLDDETNNTWSQAHFRDFMLALMNDANGPKTVNVFAHSMGNRLAVGFLDYLASAKPQMQAKIGQVIFAAPDVDSATFFEAIPRMSSVAAGLTMYGSSHDNALRASRELHGHCRAGLVGCDYAVPNVVKFNAIDASIFHCDLLGHGYWLSSDTLHADIVAVLKGGTMNSAVRPNLAAGPSPSSYVFNAALQGDTTCAAQATN